ncbi:MAG: hypothetical protein IT580_18630 [Verrucomicrobiales bacterium]|nr:hypothetical protein [Verrucomicrobiales bacterium]
MNPTKENQYQRGVPFHCRHLVLLLLLLTLAPRPVLAARFEVPGLESEMKHLEHWLDSHRVTGPDTTLWDPWLPMSVLWPETTNAPSTSDLRATYRGRLLSRRIDEEGYVSSQQHEGLGHREGWPFPLWTQSRGAGWHFSTAGLPYGPELGVRPATNTAGWTLEGFEVVGLDPSRGWTLRATGRRGMITTPEVEVDPLVAPFLRVRWAGTRLGDHARATLAWQVAGEPGFSPRRQMAFAAPGPAGAFVDAHVPLHRHPEARQTFTRFQILLEDLEPRAEITLQRLFTAVDTRHNINNAAYLQACDDYVRWSGDLEFLRTNLQRMRLALAWAIREFQLAEKQVVLTPWVGHDGRSGHLVAPDGKRTLRHGVGVGNNYWDLLPFGGEDGLATIYYFDALRRMASLERQVALHPEWNLPAGPLRFEPAELVELSRDLQTRGHERFWNESTGRFGGWRDSEGTLHDYGFTFVNNEAIYFGFADPDRARSVRSWIDGTRTVAGDTSVGADIFHWRFGPRATTRRNVDCYFWGWSDPASLAFGAQVQDGGAVLGFSFHDLMARLEVNGPDDAWKRLREILAWYAEVREAGGYRQYYAAGAGRGTLQGGGTAGGLGLDAEFFESVLVPQSVIYGFLGFRPRLDGCLIAPRLPGTWPSLTVRDIRLHDVLLDVTATPALLRVTVRGQPSRPLRLFTPGNEQSKVEIHDGTIEVRLAP